MRLPLPPRRNAVIPDEGQLKRPPLPPAVSFGATSAPSLVALAVKGSMAVMVAVKVGAESTRMMTATTVALVAVMAWIRDMVLEGALGWTQCQGETT